MRYDFKGHVKVTEIYMVKFNVSVLNRLKIKMGFFVNAKYILKYNVILNKTDKMSFFHIWSPQATLNYKNLL